MSTCELSSLSLLKAGLARAYQHAPPAEFWQRKCFRQRHLHASSLISGCLARRVAKAKATREIQALRRGLDGANAALKSEQAAVASHQADSQRLAQSESMLHRPGQRTAGAPHRIIAAGTRGCKHPGRHSQQAAKGHSETAHCRCRSAREGSVRAGKAASSLG